MDKRYQVFISSTFVDLVDERREVMQALLEMDCMPAGMELFPAGNDDQWTLIKGVIEQSDYYLVILGGRYGSMTQEGISYTEKEYEYAAELGIPVMGFVIADPDELPAKKTDKNEAAAARLDEFRAKVQKKMVKHWTNAEDLGSKVTRGLMHLIKNNPRPGWVRGDQAMTADTRVKIAELEAHIAKLEKDELEANVGGGVEQLDRSFAHGSQKIDLDVVHSGWNGVETAEQSGTLTCSWDEIVEVLGPFMIDETPDDTLRRTMDNHLLGSLLQDVTGTWATYWEDHDVRMSDRAWGSIVVQLRALNLITIGTRPRGVGDRTVYWKLTQAGDDYLVSLRAVPSALPQKSTN